MDVFSNKEEMQEKLLFIGSFIACYEKFEDYINEEVYGFFSPNSFSCKYNKNATNWVEYKRNSPKEAYLSEGYPENEWDKYKDTYIDSYGQFIDNKYKDVSVPFLRHVKYLKELEILTDKDYEAIKKIWRTRNRLTHDLYNELYKKTTDKERKQFEKCSKLYKKISQWFFYNIHKIGEDTSEIEWVVDLHENCVYNTLNILCKKS